VISIDRVLTWLLQIQLLLLIKYIYYNAP
jgi:hypothetical protein